MTVRWDPRVKQYDLTPEGYIMKDGREITHINQLRHGPPENKDWKRIEKQCLMRLAKDWSIEDIAHYLGRSVSTTRVMYWKCRLLRR